MKSYQTFMCFPHIRCSRLFVLLSDSGYALGLSALFISDTSPREPCVSRSLEVGITFLILSYSEVKEQKCVSCGAKLSQVLAFYTLCSMFFSPRLTCPGELKVSLLFLKCLVCSRKLYKAIIKQNTNNMFHVVRFNTVTLFILISPQTFSRPGWLRIMIHIRFSLHRYVYRS